MANSEWRRRFLRSRAAVRLATVAFYTGLALWATWPLARAPATTLPLGNSQIATVPLLNLWTIWWNSDRLRHGFQEYWDAPIFHPARDTFAFSEPQPATLAVAPLIWCTGSRTLAYNVYLWGSLVLNALFAQHLLRLVGARRAVAVGGGAAMLLLPLVYWQLDVLQLVPLWGVLWTWGALWKLSRRPSLLRGAEAGTAFGAAFWACAHQGLLLALVLAGSAWVLPRRWLAPALWRAGLTAVAVAAVFVFPLAARFHRVIVRHEFSRTADVVKLLSVAPADYLAISGEPLIALVSPDERPFWQLSPGWIKLVLAGAGGVLGLARRRRRRWTIFLLVAGLLAFILSLGTNLHLGSWEPWQSLTKIVPGLPQVRNVFRFAFFVQIAVVLLAAQAVHGLSLCRRCAAPRALRYSIRGIVWLLALAALVETRPLATNLTHVPDAGANAGWIAFVRANTPRWKAIACLPFASEDTVASYEIATRWMYFGTFHGVPLINGYSGFFPDEHFEVRELVNTSLLSAETLERLHEDGTRFLVVVDSELADEIPKSGIFGTVRIERVYEDPVGMDVYRLEQLESRL